MPICLLGQAQLGEQRRHLGAPGDERLGTDVDRLAAELFGAQHPAEPVGGLEHGDVRVVSERDAQPVGGDEARNTAADNAIRCIALARAHSECTSATTSVMTPGSVAGSTP